MSSNLPLAPSFIRRGKRFAGRSSPLIKGGVKRGVGKPEMKIRHRTFGIVH